MNEKKGSIAILGRRGVERDVSGNKKKGRDEGEL